MKVWRICRRRHVGAAFSGEGARLTGGRWNSVGLPLAYTSWCLSLAALEVFVNLDPEDVPEDLVWISAEVPFDEPMVSGDALIERLALPPGWRDADDVEAKAYGDAWIRSGSSLCLLVPSVVISEEWNLLINPSHKDAGKILILETKPFRFDERMFR